MEIANPFNAPVYCEKTVTSTMDVSRKLAGQSSAHGTVITADFQSKGKGRISGRSWEMKEGEGLPFTILLRYGRNENIPQAITLRTGLAVAAAIEDFAPVLQGRVKVKWPNDIMIDGKKAAGILCEAADGNVHAGIGINFAQKDFPAPLKQKATSIALSAESDFTSEQRFVLLEKILSRLYGELNAKDWKERLQLRLYKKDEQVMFIEGVADSGKEIKGLLSGINEDGALLIDNIPYITGELVIY
jgi:BirA family biotin operon repressor/biotin-[acetyl-CoA-carboxylase] ligase